MNENKTNLIIGKTGTGKTTGILFKEVLKSIQKGENLFFLDNKEEYYKTFVPKLKEEGYDVKVLNLYDLLKSNGWNPLYLPYTYFKAGKVDLAVEMINQLALEIFKSDNPNMDPFWENSAASYFTGVTLILFNEAKPEEVNLGSVSMMLTMGEKIEDGKTLMQQYLNRLDVLSTIYISLSATAYAPNETKASILSVIRDRLNLFLMKQTLLNVLCSNDIKVNELSDKTALFIIGDTKLSNNIISNIFIDQLIKSVMTEKKSFTFYLDNFDSLPVLLEFRNLVEFSLVRNLKVYVTVNTEEQLYKKYGEFIINRFSNVTQANASECMTIGNYDYYPVFVTKENNYFNFEMFMNNNE